MALNDNKVFDSAKDAVRLTGVAQGGYIKVVLYILIVILLWSFAILDAYHVINAFLNDNNATFVTSVEIKNDSLDFVEDAMVCVHYDHSILQRVWNKSDDLTGSDKTHDDAFIELEANDWDLTERVFGTIDFKNSDQNGTVPLTRLQFIHGVQTMRIVRSLDGCEYDKALKPESNSCFAKSVRKYWTDEQLVKLKKTIDPLFEKASFNDDPSSAVSLDRFTVDRICHKIRVKNAITESELALENRLPIGLRENTELGNVSSIRPQTFELTFPFLTLKEEFDSRIRYHFFKILVKSRGLFDKTGSGHCHGTSLPQFGADCKHYQYVQQLKKNCRCIPLTLENLDDQQDKAEYGYCSSATYTETCTNAVSKYMADNFCEHCVTTQNDYTLTYEYDSANNTAETGVFISFMMSDKFFTRYKQTTKTTLAATVAQVGGDIGFYTGFSLWALWKFLMFLTATLRDRRRVQRNRRKTIKRETDSKSLFAAAAQRQESLFRVTFGYLEGGDDGLKKEKDEQLKEAQLKQRLRVLEEAAMTTFASFEKRIKEVQEELRKKEQEDHAKEDRAKKEAREKSISEQKGTTVINIS